MHDTELVLANVVVQDPLTQLVEWSKVYREKGFEGLAAVMNGLPVEQRRSRDDYPLTHRFTKSLIDGRPRGLYVREVRVPASNFILTERHKTQHPFVVSAGACSIWTPENGVVRIEAPHTGITEPGTQRLILVHEDTVWTTFHPTDETDVDKIEEQLIDHTGAFAPIDISTQEAVEE